MSFTDIHPDFRLPDEVWQQVQAAIPPDPPKPKERHSQSLGIHWTHSTTNGSCPLGEETRELLGDAPLSLCLYCGLGNSGFRIGF